jgi:hypothetical protein
MARTVDLPVAASRVISLGVADGAGPSSALSGGGVGRDDGSAFC